MLAASSQTRHRISILLKWIFTRVARAASNVFTCSGERGQLGDSHGTCEKVGGPILALKGFSSTQSCGFSVNKWFIKVGLSATSQSMPYIDTSSISSSRDSGSGRIPWGPSCIILKRKMSWGLHSHSPLIWSLCEFQTWVHSSASSWIQWRKRWWRSHLSSDDCGLSLWLTSRSKKKVFHFIPKPWVMSYHMHSMWVLCTLLSIFSGGFNKTLNRYLTCPRYMSPAQVLCSPPSTQQL